MRRTRSRTIAAVAALAACAVALTVGSASAAASVDPLGGPGWGSNPNPHHGPGHGITSGSDGGYVTRSVNSCSVYSNSGSYGLSCAAGSGGGDVKNLKEYLAGQSLPTCWDTTISNGALWKQYGKTPDTENPYYVETCVNGLDLDRSPWYQPDMQINQQLIQIAANSPQCTNYDVDKKKPTPFDPNVVCVKTLTEVQNQVVGYLDSRIREIPGITLVRYPSTTVHTNQPVAYQDEATTKNGLRTQTQQVTLGNVTVWAVMTNYFVRPDGVDSDPICQSADGGTQPLTQTDDEDSAPDACWYSYPQSSAGLPDDAYSLRAEADWTVYYQGTTGGPQVLATYKKYITVQQPVYDVQTQNQSVDGTA